MVYEFSFDGKSLWALFGGSAVLCLLLFFAGLLLGANWNSPDGEAAQTTAAPAAAQASAQPAPGAQDASHAVATQPYATLPPQEPLVYDRPAAQDYAAQGYAAQGYAAQGYGAQGYEAQGHAAQGYGARPPEPQVYGARQRPAAPPAASDAADAVPAAREVAADPSVNFRREAARLSAAGIDPDPRLVSEADAPASPGSASYSVQVGAYVAESEARRLLSDLENKGYTPTLFSGRDAEGRAWYAVRIGAYANQREATQAAQNFSRQERLKAAVRPFNSL